METEDSFERFVTLYQITRRHTPEDVLRFDKRSSRQSCQPCSPNSTQQYHCWPRVFSFPAALRQLTDAADNKAVLSATGLSQSPPTAFLAPLLPSFVPSFLPFVVVNLLASLLTS
jgi:hypothetical protein